MSCITEKNTNWSAEGSNLSIKMEEHTLEINAYTIPRRGYKNHIDDLVREHLTPYSDSGDINRIETLKSDFDEVTGFAVYAGDTMVLKVVPRSWSKGKTAKTRIGVEIWPVVEQVTESKRLASAFEIIAKLDEPYVLFWDGGHWSIKRVF